jgi:hypothetical protein
MNKFDKAIELLNNLYNELLSNNDEFSKFSSDPCKTVKYLNKLRIDHDKKHKGHPLSIYLNVKILIWFNYHKIHKNYYDLFCQYPAILKMIDKWIKKSEIYYMKLEDKPV